LGILETSTFRRIEKHFYLYDKIAQAVQEAREQMMYGHTGMQRVGGDGHCYVSDPTAVTAINLAEPVKWVVVDGETIRRPEDWMRVVEATWERFAGTEIGELLKRRYQLNEPFAITCRALHIDTRTYYRWREAAMIYAAFICVQLKLIKVF